MITSPRCTGQFRGFTATVYISSCFSEHDFSLCEEIKHCLIKRVTSKNESKCSFEIGTMKTYRTNERKVVKPKRAMVEHIISQLCSTSLSFDTLHSSPIFDERETACSVRAAMATTRTPTCTTITRCASWCGTNSVVP